MTAAISAPFQKGDKVQIKDSGSGHEKGTQAEVVTVGYSPEGLTNNWHVKVRFDGRKAIDKGWWSALWFKKAKQ